MLRPHALETTLLACAVVMAAEASAGQQITRDAWSVDLPGTWQPIPRAEIEAAKRVMVSDPSKIVYDACFQRDNHDQPFTYPYVTVQRMDYDKIGLRRRPSERTMRKLVNELSGFRIKDADEMLTDEAKTILGDHELGSASFDAERKQFQVHNASMMVAGVGKVRSVLIGYFGNEAIYQVLYCDLESNWDDAAAAGERAAIFDSFQLTPQAAYRELGFFDLGVGKLIGVVGAIGVAMVIGWAIKSALGTNKRSKEYDFPT